MALADAPRSFARGAVADAALVSVDPRTLEHSDDVELLADELCMRLGVNGSEREAILLGARLHDVGKSAVPQSLLDKPGPLDESEWEVMREHTIVGERILLGVPELEPAAPLVRSSHEHYDGSGYPDGLEGDEIPLGSRIILCADAFHAMRTDRPYRRGRPTSEAISEIKANAGSQFDPDVVEALIDSIALTRAVPRRRIPMRVAILFAALAVGTGGAYAAERGWIPSPIPGLGSDKATEDSSATPIVQTSATGDLAGTATGSGGSAESSGGGGESDSPASIAGTKGGSESHSGNHSGSSGAATLGSVNSISNPHTSNGGGSGGSETSGGDPGRGSGNGSVTDPQPNAGGSPGVGSGGDLGGEGSPGGGSAGEGSPGNSGNAPGHTGSTPGQSGSAPGHSGSNPGHGGSPPGQTGSSPGQSGSTPGQSGSSPGNSGSPPGQSGSSPGNSGGSSGSSGAAPGNSGSAPSQGGTPPGQGGTPPGQGGTPPGQTNSAPAQSSTPPGNSGNAPGQGGSGGNPHS